MHSENIITIALYPSPFHCIFIWFKYKYTYLSAIPSNHSAFCVPHTFNNICVKKTVLNVFQPLNDINEKLQNSKNVLCLIQLTFRMLNIYFE